MYLKHARDGTAGIRSNDKQMYWGKLAFNSDYFKKKIMVDFGHFIIFATLYFHNLGMKYLIISGTKRSYEPQRVNVYPPCCHFIKLVE